MYAQRPPRHALLLDARPDGAGAHGVVEQRRRASIYARHRRSPPLSPATVTDRSSWRHDRGATERLEVDGAIKVGNATAPRTARCAGAAPTWRPARAARGCRMTGRRGRATARRDADGAGGAGDRRGPAPLRDGHGYVRRQTTLTTFARTLLDDYVASGDADDAGARPWHACAGAGRRNSRPLPGW